MARLDDPKHEVIAQRLAAGDSQAKALKAAGYAPKNAGSQAARLLKAHPEIKQRSEELRRVAHALEDRAKAAILERKEIDRNYVRLGLQEVYERCMQAQPVLDRKGIPTGEWEFDAANALRALEDLGKDLGMFVDRKELGAPGAFKTIEERKEAEKRIKLKLVKSGMAKLIGAGSMAGKSTGESADQEVSAPQAVDVIESGSVVEPIRRVEPPQVVAEPDPIVTAEADAAPIPPGVEDEDLSPFAALAAQLPAQTGTDRLP